MRRFRIVVVLTPLALVGATHAIASEGFGSARVFPAGVNPIGIAIADFNGDGKPDVVVANNSAVNSNGSLSVLLNNGDGTFTQVQTSVTNSFALAVAVADFNGDGKLDVAFFGQSSFGVMFGNGDGTFSSLTTYALKSSGSYPISIAVGDFNGDNSPDVAIAVLNDSAIQLFSNNGNGTFTDHGETPTCGNPASIVVADFNRDGHQDIAVACQTGSVSIMLGDGNNNFSMLPINAFVPGPNSIAAADLNGDGIPDLVTANMSGSSASVFLGNGDGTFRVSTPIALPAKPISVAILDVNGDGKPDVLELTQGVNDLVVLTGKGDGTFNAPAVFDTGGTPLPPWNDRLLVVADFNGDGRPDVVADTDGYNVSLLLGMGDGTFAPSAQSILTGAGTAWVAAGDLNGDKVVDFVVANSAANSVSIFTGNATNQFTPGATYSVGTDPEFVGLADLNNDGHLDIVAVCKGDSVTPGSVVILLGNGDGTFTPAAASLAPGQAPIAAAVADFNNDGKLDLAIVDEGDDKTTSVVAVYLGNGDGSFTGPTDFPVGVSPKAIAAGQLTTTGHIDLVVGNSLNLNVSVLQGNGIGGFTTVATLPLPLGPESSVAIADLNGDGLADVISTGGSGIVVFMNQGNYQFSGGQTYVTEQAVMRVAAGDFDGDGRQDVVAVGQGTGVDLLLGNGDGTFKPYIGFAAGVSAWSFTVADVNNDGLPDVLVATQGVNPLPPSVTILLNALGLSGSLSASPNPSEYEQPVTFTANFTPIVRQSLAGNVVFKDSGSALGSVSLDSAGQAQFQVGLAAGMHTISAQYSGTGFIPLTKTLAQTVTQAPAVINVASSSNPSLAGAAVTLTATFTGPFGGTGSGTFSFAEGSSTLNSGNVNGSGQGTLSKADWSAGPHAVTITYSGDANLAPATATYSQDVQNPTSTTVTSSTPSAVVGTSITLTAVVTSAAAPSPTGTVNFVADGSSTIGSANLDGSGHAVLSTSSIPAGVHAITANYPGDSYSAASSAQATTVSVADFSASSSASSATVRAGQSATFNLTVTSLGGFNNAVTFACSGLPLYASCAFTPLSATPAANGSTSVQMTVTTAGAAFALAHPRQRGPETYFAFAIFGFVCLVGWVFVPAGRQRKRYLCFLSGCLMLLMILVGCGGDGGSKTPPPQITPPGTSSITVTMTSNVSGATITHSIQVSMTVTP